MLPVLIAGAGPTGLTAALELSRFGIPVRIIDRLPTPRTSSRAIGVQARTVELMAQRGLAPQMLATGNLGHAVNVYGNGQRAIHLDMARIESRFNALLLLSQADTERILTEAVGRAGVEVERGVELVGLAQAGDHAMGGHAAGDHAAEEAAAQGSGPHEGTSGRGQRASGETGRPGPRIEASRPDGVGPEAPVRAFLRHPDGTLEGVDASWLISAEGAHSLARTTLAIPFEGRTLPATYALGDLAMAPMLPADELHAFTSDQGLLAVFPFGGNRIRLVATSPEASGRDHPAPPTLAELQRLYDRGAHIPARFSDLTWSSWFRINSRMVGRLRAGRVLLGGDAAHIHSPVGGQGMNTGIQDMINLCWKLALVIQGRADPALIDTYEQERLPVMRSLLSTTEEITRVMGSGSALVRGVLTHLGPWVGASGLVQGNAAARVSQIAVNYRGSPLAVDHRPGGGLRAGDRVPDLAVQVQLRDGEAWQATNLHAMLDPSSFVMLLVGEAGSETAAHVAHVRDVPPAGGALDAADHTRSHPAASPPVTSPPAASPGVIDAPGPPRGGAGDRSVMRSVRIRPPEVAEDAARFRTAFGRSAGAFLVRPDGYLALASGERGADGQVKAFREKWLPRD